MFKVAVVGVQVTIYPGELGPVEAHIWLVAIICEVQMACQLQDAAI